MDHADLFDRRGCALNASFGSNNVQAAPVGGFGGVQVADGGHFVGVAEVEVTDGFISGVADALVVPNGFLVCCHAVGAALLAQDMAQGER